jgi:hypothetical protein
MGDQDFAATALKAKMCADGVGTGDKTWKAGQSGTVFYFYLI